MSFKFGDVSSSLPRKGFVEDRSRDHRYYYLYHLGKKTQYYTKVSHGKPGDDVGHDLVSEMRRQLGLGTGQQVRQLVECTMDGTAYIKALQDLGRLPKPEKAGGTPANLRRR